MRKIIALSFFVLFTCLCYAQEGPPPHLEGKISYPVFNYHMYMGVIKTDNTVLQYDANMDYKVVVDVYDKIKDSTKLTSTLLTVGRTYNLNIANGVPQDKMKMAVVFHGFAVYSLLNDKAYEEKFGIKNPNLEAIRGYKKAGLDLYVCGQNLGFFNLPRENLTPEIDVAISAKTALIALDQKGYTYMNVNQD